MRQFKISTIILALLTLLLGIFYPVLMWGIGQLFFHKRTNGTLIYSKTGDIVGSELIAQNFMSDKYFHPRPSAAGDKGYDAANSSGSNLGPTSKKLMDVLKDRVKAYRAENHWSDAIPADAVTASGSGLDPHISLENAKIQSARVASARNVPQETVDQLIQKYAESPTFGIFGEKRVNVLQINLALDRL